MYCGTMYFTMAMTHMCDAGDVLLVVIGKELREYRGQESAVGSSELTSDKFTNPFRNPSTNLSTIK